MASSFAGESRSPTLGRLISFGLVTACAAAMIFSLGVGTEIGWEEGMLCLLATAALVAAALPLVIGRRVELVEPVTLVVLMVAVGVTAKAFYICLGPAERVEFLLRDKRPGDLLFAALVIAAGVLCLSCGYLLTGLRWRLPRVFRNLRAAWDPPRLFAVAGILVIVGMLSFLLFSLRFDVSFESLSDLSAKRLGEVRGSRIPGGMGYLRWGATLIEIAFYLVLAHWIASGRRLLSGGGAAVLALALASAVYPFFTSSRLTIMLMILRAIIIWMCIRGEPRPRSVAAVVAVGFLIISPMLALRRGASDWESVGAELSPARLVEATVGGRHFLDLSKTAHVLAAVPDEIDYQYGQTLVTWLVAPVPRELWPAKPPVNVGKLLGPALFESSPGSGVPPGIVGELYLNFGLPGVFVGLLAFGLVLRSLYLTLRPHFSNPAAVLVYTLLSTRMAIGMVSLSASGGLTRLLKEMVPLLLALYFLGRRSAGEAEEPGRGESVLGAGPAQ